MRCAEDSFKVLKRPVEVEKGWGSYSFCPGKATWYEEVVDLYDTCRIAVETGILPKGRSLDDQDPLFLEALPFFLHHWRERNYDRMWTDIRALTKAVLETVLGKKKGGK